MGLGGGGCFGSPALEMFSSFWDSSGIKGVEVVGSDPVFCLFDGGCAGISSACSFLEGDFLTGLFLETGLTAKTASPSPSLAE